MYDIDSILEMLDWNCSQDTQLEGRRLGMNVKCVNTFMQPGAPYGKRIWENCAKIVASKSDEVLQYYLRELFDWIQDLNWPGAIEIKNRLMQYPGADYDFWLQYCYKCATATGDKVWADTLISMKRSEEWRSI